MQQELLALFPLSVVLFPRIQLPLHIFEDRYKEMIGDAIRDHSEFGVVLASDDGLAATGCTAVVDRITRRYEDGRLDIVTVGVRRFEIQSLDTERAFLRGDVSYFNDEETGRVSAAMKKKAVVGYRELRRFLQDGPGAEPEWNDPQLSFQLAQSISDLEFRQQLLMLRSERERIRRLAEFFPSHVARQRHIQHVQSVAPGNGHGPRVPDL